MTRRRILVPIDLDAQSDSALDFARNIATRLNAMISCMYVIEEQIIHANKHSSRETKLKQRRDAENGLSEKVNSILNEAKTPFEIIITYGKVHEMILEKSRDLNAQTIVMGRSNPTHKKANRTGSNTKRIVANAQVPVLTITNQRIEKPKKLILPLDLDTPFSDQVNWAIESALLLDASVSVIAVVEKEMSGRRPVYLKKLKESSRMFCEKGIACDTHLLENETTISREILSFSERVELGIILLMIHQKKNSGSQDLGSIVAEVLAKTELPVLFINPKNKSRFSFDSSTLNNIQGYLSSVPTEDSLTNNQQEI
jgi:nucleotide-binding universal stress UspA family protein